jgi:redox-sensitive bicupin YhaK (pirin superfamily)
MKNIIQMPISGISALIKPVEKDLGGFTVRRYIPHALQKRIGPFVFFDHMGPAEFEPGKGIDVRPHPHIGLATITYLFEGEIYHRDSLGYVQPITPGAVNWMTAGKGIVHSERTGDETRAQGHRLHGLQVWVGLPEEHEETDPGFVHYDKGDMPEVKLGGITLRVIIGSAFGETSPIFTHSLLFYLDVNLPAGESMSLPEDYEERGLHVVDGTVLVNGYTVNSYEMMVCKPGEKVEISTESSARVVLFGGASLSDRHVWWNFVSSSRERIEQAKKDWKDGRFDAVPGEVEFIPLPE